jgi:transposase
MWLDYPHCIGESVEQLLTQEKRLRDSTLADRIKMLRLLKSGRYRSQTQLAPVLGHSDRTLRRWWQLYQREGLSGLVTPSKVGGSQERIDASARQVLEAEMKAGQIATLAEARAFLQSHFDIRYRSLSSVSRWCQRHGIKLKTGRPQHMQTSLAQQEAFKKTSKPK